jgi:hypothetical protein
MPKPLEPMWTDEEIARFDREWRHLGYAINATLVLGFLCAMTMVLHG